MSKNVQHFQVQQLSVCTIKHYMQAPEVTHNTADVPLQRPLQRLCYVSLI